MKITKEQLRQIIREEQAIVMEDSRKKEMDNLKKNIEDDKEHLEDLEQDIKDDEKEEERDRKDEAHCLNKEELQEMIRNEVASLLKKKRLSEAVSKKEQLRQAVEMWMTNAGLEPENAIALKLAIQKQMRARPKQRHAAMQDVLGQHWASGPDFEADVNDVAYAIMGEEKPERAAQPEEEETEAQRLRRAKRVAAIDAKMGGKYR